MDVLALGLTLWMAADPAAGPSATLLQYGAVGAIAAGGAWFGLLSYRREVRRADALTVELSRVQDAHATELARVRDAHAAELRQSNAEMRDRQVPVLVEAVKVLGDVTALMRERR